MDAAQTSQFLWPGVIEVARDLHVAEVHLRESKRNAEKDQDNVEREDIAGPILHNRRVMFTVL